MAENKRERFLSSPTGRTPRQRSKRMDLRHVTAHSDLHEPRRLLLGESSEQSDTPAILSQRTAWSDGETKALLEFLLLHRPGDKWPSTKNQQFWNSAAEFVELRGEGRIRRSGRFIIKPMQASIIYAYVYIVS